MKANKVSEELIKLVVVMRYTYAGSIIRNGDLDALKVPEFKIPSEWRLKLGDIYTDESYNNTDLHFLQEIRKEFIKYLTDHNLKYDTLIKDMSYYYANY